MTRAQQVDLSWVDPPQFRAITGDEPGEFLEFIRADGKVYVGGEATDNEWTWLPDDDPRALGQDDTFDSSTWRDQLAEQSVHRQVEVEDAPDAEPVGTEAS